MDIKEKFLLINTKALPEVFLKVSEAKKLMDSGRYRYVQDAVNKVGISRSVFYKYRNSVFPYYKNETDYKITFAMSLEDKPGLLSKIINILAESAVNILTINQTIPINSIANVTITIETKSLELEEVFNLIRDLDGLRDFKILGGI